MLRPNDTNSYWIFKLLNIQGIGNAKVIKILDTCRGKGLTISDFIMRIIHREEKLYLITPAQLTDLSKENNAIDEQWKKLREEDIKFLAYGNDDYPMNRFSSLNNKAPVLLFAKGNISLLDKPSLGFCGSRKASEKGLKTAWDCADQMSQKDVNIVSGYAAGVDITSHKAALEAGGSTTIVLAEGILLAPL